MNAPRLRIPVLSFKPILFWGAQGLARDDEMIARAVKLQQELASRDGLAVLGEDGWEYLDFDKTSPQREYAIEKQDIRIWLIDEGMLEPKN